MADDDLTPARPVKAQLDPSKSNFVTIVGRKGSGKSELAARLWDGYPFDRLALDPTGDARVGFGVTELHAPLPARWPADLQNRRVSLRFVPDPGSPTYGDDLDRACGLAFRHRRVMLWIDEVGELTRTGKTAPNFARILQQGRHRDITLLCCGPRPMTIDPLVVAQADYVYVFQLPNPADRRRVADVIGYDPKDFDAAVNALAQYEYLRWDSREQELIHFPPIPPVKTGPPAPPLPTPTLTG